jgi:hypothetical protein
LTGGRDSLTKPRAQPGRHQAYLPRGVGMPKAREALGPGVPFRFSPSQSARTDDITRNHPAADAPAGLSFVVTIVAML